MRNILQTLSNFNASDKSFGIDATYLSSGYFYDKTRTEAYIREENEIWGIQNYSIINSPIIAPMAAAGNIAKFRTIKEDRSTTEIIKGFIIEKGPFDIIHFQSFEGISPNVLNLRKTFPKTLFIHSWHDYGCVCPNVKLWTSTNQNCYVRPMDSCKKCMLVYQFRTKQLMKLRPLTLSDTIQKESLPNKIFRKILEKGIGSLMPSILFEIYRDYKAHTISLINSYSDCEIAVSNRVREIAEHFGVRKDLVRINYIGTKVADNFTNKRPALTQNEFFTILYMGYPTKPKGFYFLIDALDNINKDIAKKVRLKFATKIDRRTTLDKVNCLRRSFKDVILYNGYSHADIPGITSDVDLGIVPPLWEDNLPQVALEMISNGIPILTSSRGGAHETNSSLEYMFSDKVELISKIEYFVSNKAALLKYWTTANPPITMSRHIDELRQLYRTLLSKK